MAHLTTLKAKQCRIFRDAEVLSMAFGAPLCVTQPIVNSITTDEWTTHFLTIVKEDDPIPRILNVAATIQNAENKFEGMEEFFASITGLTEALSGIPSVERAIKLGKSLMTMLPKVKDFICKHDGVYKPLGIYLFARKQNPEYFEGAECSERLGGADLFHDGLSLDKDKLVAHSMNSYHKAFSCSAVKSTFVTPEGKSGYRRIKAGQEPIPNFLFNGSAPDSLPAVPADPEGLPFKVISAEFLVFEGVSKTINLHLVGQGLDFVGDLAVQAQEVNDLRWTQHSCSETYLLLQADPLSLSQSKTIAKQTTLKIVVEPDMQGIAEQNRCVEATPQSDKQGQLTDAFVFNEQFLSTMMKAAWVFKNVLKDDTGIALLDNLDRAAKEHTTYTVQPSPVVVTFRSLISKVKCQRGIDQVGSLDCPEVRAHIQHVHDWLCPRGGHVCHTEQQKVGRGLCLVVVVGGIIAAGTGIAALAGATTMVLNGGAYVGSGVALAGASAGVRSQLSSPLQRTLGQVPKEAQLQQMRSK